MTTNAPTGDVPHSLDPQIVTDLRQSRASWMYVEFMTRFPEAIPARRLAELHRHGYLSDPATFTPDHSPFGMALFHGNLSEALMYADSSNEERLSKLLQL